MTDAWLVKIEEKEIGPLSPKELKQLVAENKVGPDTPIMKVGTPKWVAASKVKGLLAAPGKPEILPRPQVPEKKQDEPYRPDPVARWKSLPQAEKTKILVIGGVLFLAMAGAVVGPPPKSEPEKQAKATFTSADATQAVNEVDVVVARTKEKFLNKLREQMSESPELLDETSLGVMKEILDAYASGNDKDGNQLLAVYSKGNDFRVGEFLPVFIMFRKFCAESREKKTEIWARVK